MKEILLKRIVIDNFRGIKHFDSEIGETLTVIAGDNATGKSTIFVAFTWCLFGKDELDRKDFEIKPCVAGKSVRIETSVELHLIIDGQSHLLRRGFHENWVQHSGEVKETYEGNETSCFWDDAPINVTEYKKRVSEIVDEKLFKMLTNPYYFPSLKWNEQRAALFAICPAASDEEIAQRDKAFTALLEELNGKKLADFKKEIGLALKKLRKSHSEIQPRIDEVRRTIPEQLGDKASIEAQLNANEKMTRAIDAELQSQTDAALQQSERIRDKRKEIDDALVVADRLVADAVREEKERVEAANREHDTLQHEIDNAKRKLQGDKNYLEAYKKQTARIETERDNLLKKHAELREEYIETDKKTFGGNAICPTCGQTLPAAMQNEAEARFNTNKQKELDSIVSRGDALKTQIEESEASIKRRSEDAKKQEENIEAQEKSIAESEARLSEIAVVTENEIQPPDVKGYTEQMQRVETLRGELKQLDNSDGTDTEKKAKLNEQREELRRQHDEMKRQLSDIETADKANKRIEELEAEGRKLAQDIADYEKRVFVATQFEQAKVEDLEKHVNSLFHNVKWKLFDYTLDGNIVETCVAIVGNALYPVANSAAQINAGLDIIHTLSEYYGLRCPIFIDNAEGITNIENHGLQLVTLYVEKDARLEVRTIQ